MISNGPLWLTDADVASLMTINDTIEALRDTLAAQAKGQARNVRKALATWGGGRSSAHSLGSMHEAAGLVGFKTWVNTPDGASTAYALFGADDGRLIALMQAASLGSLRTSAISGLATSVLAPEDADEIAIVGTGRQALYRSPPWPPSARSAACGCSARRRNGAPLSSSGHARRSASTLWRRLPLPMRCATPRS